MKHFRLIAVVMMGLAVSACATVETVTRAAPLETLEMQPVSAPFDVQGIRVSVPKSLRVSEANLFYPGGDIVWRGDPSGDRRQQVKAIFEAAMQQGVGETVSGGGIPAYLDIEVTRFHALSEKARYTIGGVHALQFKMVLLNPETGEAYGAPRFVKADFKAFGGARAIKAERNGITQKYRITERLAEVIRMELTDPSSFKAEKLGLIGALNQI